LDWTFSVLLPKLFCLFLICHYWVRVYTVSLYLNA
jgi:hypothetical protein